MGKCIVVLMSIVFFSINSLAACSDSDKEKYIKADNTEFAPTLRKCAIGAFGLKNATSRALVNALPELTKECADCFAKTVVCTKKNCPTCAINNSSEDCIKCSKEKCVPALVECTGVAEADLPPSETKK